MSSPLLPSFVRLRLDLTRPPTGVDLDLTHSRLQYMLHKVASQNFTKSHCLPHPHSPTNHTPSMFTRMPTTPTLASLIMLTSISLTSINQQQQIYHHNAITCTGMFPFVLLCLLTIFTGLLHAHPHPHLHTCLQSMFSLVCFLFFISFTNYYYKSSACMPTLAQPMLRLPPQPDNDDNAGTNTSAS